MTRLKAVVCMSLFAATMSGFSGAERNEPTVDDIIASGDPVLTANDHYRTYELEGGAAEFSCDNLRVRIAANALVVSIKRLPDGKELLNRSTPSLGFHLIGRDAEPIPFASLKKLKDNNYMVVSKYGSQKVIFSVAESSRYIAFRIESLIGIPRSSNYTMAFDIRGDHRIRPMPLDYMTFFYGHDPLDRSFPVSWPALWMGNENYLGETLPRGGFALYYDGSDAEEDEVLAHIWANENLPHPKVDYEWDVAGVRRWMGDWTRTFADRSSFWYSHVKGRDEFERLLPHINRMGLREIHFYHWTWHDSAHHCRVKKGGFFPNGRKDLVDFAQRLDSLGKNLSLHYNWCEINKEDPIFIGRTPRKDLADWGSGRLGESISRDDTTLFFIPDPGVELPSREWHDQPPPALNHWVHYNFIHVGDEIIRFEEALNTEGRMWLLRGCTRGVGSTESAAHAQGTVAKGLLANYGARYIPRTFSPLFHEMIREQAELWNDTQMSNMNYDGANPHYWSGANGIQIRVWLEEAYKQFDHPTFYDTGHGCQLWGHFEHYMNAFKKVEPVRMGFRGDMGVRPRTASLSRAAATVDEAHLRMAQVASVKHSDFSMHIPLHYPSDWEQYGRFDELVELVRNWKDVSPRLSDSQRQRIRKTMEPPLNRGFTSEWVWWLRKEDGVTKIYPQKNPMTRRGGDVKWGCMGGEVGWVTPQQYITFGQSLELENPFHQQPPQFTLRVISKFDYQAADNIPLFTDLEHISNPTEMKLTKAANGLAIEYDNSGRGVLDGKQAPLLATWKQSLDLTRHRGIGMMVKGDRSGAILLIRSGTMVRDYPVKLDFEGERYIEIPNGEVYWAGSDWGGPHRCAAASDSYKPQRLQIGIGFVPANTKVSVSVHGIKALKEIAAVVDDPGIVLNDGDGNLVVKGTLRSGQWLDYRGGDTAKLYDENWNPIADLPVTTTNYHVGTGFQRFQVTAGNEPEHVWVSTRFITEGTPIIVKEDRP